GRVDVRMKVVVTSAEPLGEDQRAAIEAAFGCPVRETYGMTENVAAASECEAGGLHQWPEVGVIEAVDEEFICTGLINDAMPLIRYRLGDRGRLAPAGETCPCGRTLPLIAAIEGRTSDLLVTSDGRRIFWMNPVLYGLPVRQGQIVQESVRRIRVRFVPTPAFTEVAGRTLVARIRDRLGVLSVDGMSEDRTRPIVAAYAKRHRAVRLIDNSSHITPAGLNAGIRAARGDVIVRMDAHVVYPPDYIALSVAALEQTGADNVGPVIVTRPADGNAVARAIAVALSHPFGVGNSHFRIGSRERRWVDTVPFG